MRTSLLCLAMMAAVGLTACNRTSDNQQTVPPAPSTTPDTPSTAPAPTAPSTGTTSDTPAGTTASDAGDALKDTAITAKVKAALATTDDLKDSSISVETVAGRVTLTGKLPNETQHKKAVDVVRSVDGVRDVDSRITVGNS